MDIVPGILIALISKGKTMEDAEKYLNSEKVEIKTRWGALRGFVLEVPIGLEAAWKEKLLLSGFFKAVDFDRLLRINWSE